MFSSGSFLGVSKKQAKTQRTFIKLEIPAKLPAKNSLFQVKTVKGDLLWELSLFEYIQIVPIWPTPLTLFIFLGIHLGKNFIFNQVGQKPR